MSIAILDNIQNAQAGMAFECIIDQKQYLLSKSDMNYIIHQKRSTYMNFRVLRAVIRLRVSLWILFVLCAFDTKFMFSFASIQSMFWEDGRLVAWALSSKGASSTFEETKIKEEYISDMNI
jgi:hypothetical protein